MLLLYDLAVHALLPFVLLYALVLAIRHRGLPPAWRGYFMLDLPALPADRPVVWVHAASVGEARAALPVLGALRRHWPRVALISTATTAAGRAQIARHGAVDAPLFLPLDLPWLVGRLARRVRPVLLLVLETEVWPNLLASCRAHGARVVVVNGRFSPRREHLYRTLAPVYRSLLEPVSLFLMQGEEDARIARVLARDPSIVRVVGDLKVDQVLAAARAIDPAEVRARLGLSGRRVIVAGSLHPGEDSIVARSFARLARRHEGLALVMAPRHIDRADECDKALAAAGVTGHRRTAGPLPAAASVLVLDAIGELSSTYAVAQAAFVGGSLVDVGGHNPFEPAAVGCPLSVGPHTENFGAEVDALIAARGATRVDSEDELLGALDAWLKEPDEARAAGRRAQRAVESMGGALDRVREALGDCLGPPDTP